MGTPAEDLSYVLSDLEELYEVCGESRLWGGMHFDAAVSGSFELCGEIGNDAYEFMKNIVAGNEEAFEGTDEEIPPFAEEYVLELELTGAKDKIGADEPLDDLTIGLIVAVAILSVFSIVAILLVVSQRYRNAAMKRGQNGY